MENNEFMNAQPEILGIIDATKSYLYEELWKFCASPLVDLPTIGSKVYYFPQGNIQHIKESTKEDLDMIKPLFDLPTKILCEVVNIKLEADKITDEGYAQISLIPDTINIPITDGNRQRPIVHSFTKVLTVSDTTTHSGLSISRRHATKCLPPLDVTQPTPTQELVVKDLHGYEWRIKHTFRGTPRRHLFTAGWSAFVTSKRLVAGDSFIFLRGENEELRVGIRRADHQKYNISSSVISTECMHNGVIASTVHAINTHCVFAVMYKPRISQFVVSYEKYINAMDKNFHVGSRFKMRFEGGNFTEIRYSGTIVGVSDISPHWKDSEWQSLEVQWDDPASIPRPDKVSPWEIEPLVSGSNVPQLAFLKNKRFRQVNEIGSTSLHPWNPTFNQGHETGQSSMRSHISVPHLSYRAIEDSKIPSDWLMRNYRVLAMSKPNNNDQMVLPIKKRMIISATSSCKLFGVDKEMNPSGKKDPIGPINSHQKFEISKLPEEKKFDHIQTPKSTKEIQIKQVNFTRIRTKVQMQGVAIGRSVDLTLFDGYNPLIDELEKLFNLKGALRTHNQWEITFTDNEGDMMLVKDYSWPEFCNIAKKIFICSKEEVKKMKSGNKLSRGESKFLTSSDMPANIKN